MLQSSSKHRNKHLLKNVYDRLGMKKCNEIASCINPYCRGFIETNIKFCDLSGTARDTNPRGQSHKSTPASVGEVN